MKITFAILFLTLFVFCILPVRAGDGEDVFLITVTLEDPYNSHLQLCLPVKVGQPFQVVSTIGKTVTEVSGTLGPLSKGKHLLPIKISEAITPFPAGSTTSQTYALEIDKPQSWTFMAGRLVFQHTVLLSQFKAK